MTDLALLVAAFIIERLAAGIEPGAVWVEICERWPDLTVAEADRGAQIAEEVLGAEIAENEALSAVRVVEEAEERVTGANEG